LPVKVHGALALGEVNVKFKSIVGTMTLTKKFVGNNVVATRQHMVGKCMVPRAKSRDSVVVTFRRVTQEVLEVKFTFEDSTVLKDDLSSIDRWIGVVGVDGAIDPKIFSHVADAKNFVWILLVIKTVSNLKWKGFIVEYIRQRYGGYGRRGRGWSGGCSSQRLFNIAGLGVGKGVVSALSRSKPSKSWAK
jgi:hypothetical protein